MAKITKRFSEGKTRWLKVGAVVAFLYAISQIYNHAIERSIDRELDYVFAEDFGTHPKDISTRILAVEMSRKGQRDKGYCREDCALLLLSGEIDQYLDVYRPQGAITPHVMAFKIEDKIGCALSSHFDGRYMSRNLENTIRHLSLSGSCLTAHEATLDLADTLIVYNSINHSSSILPEVKGQGISISKKDAGTGKWIKLYKRSHILYKKGALRRSIYSSAPGHKLICKETWLDDRGPCHRWFRYRPPSEILGLPVSESQLKRSEIMPDRDARYAAATKLVETIRSDTRLPTVNEWALINRYITSDFSSDEAYAALVLNVISSHNNFPLPDLSLGMDKLDAAQKRRLVAAIFVRLGRKVLGPEIGDFDKNKQDYHLYKIIKNLPSEFVAPYFDDLIKAASVRSYEKQSTVFLEKFGPKSRQPKLSGIEAPLLDLAKAHEISLAENYGQIVYLLMDLGVEEAQLLETVDETHRDNERDRAYILRYIKKYRQGKNRCRL